MLKYFPPDVSLRVEGDLADARPLFGLARATLFKALEMRDKAGVSVGGLTARAGEAGYVQVYLAGPIKIVWVSTGKGPVDTTTVDEPVRNPTPGVEFEADMLHGWIDTGTLVAGAGGITRLRSYRPTGVCASVNNLPAAYHENEKLAVPNHHPELAAGLSQYGWLKPSMYSGTMKRVVQALFGVGKVKDTSKVYVTGLAPSSPERTIQVLYDYKWARTHGVYKAAEKNHWLVEISAVNGVIAMPLPLFSRTTTTTYRNKVAARGDTDTLKVLDEFGGIPSGEMFPSGAALSALITSGKALRLLTAAEIQAFYDKNPYSLTWGWAFSESGRQAHNTAYDAHHSVLRAWHYGIDISLTPHDVSPPAGSPVGAGTAKFQEINNAYILIFAKGYAHLGFRNVLRVPMPVSDEMADFPLEPSVWHTLTLSDVQTPEENPSLYRPTIMVFFVGEQLEAVRGSAWQTNGDFGPEFYSHYLRFYGSSLDVRNDVKLLRESVVGFRDFDISRNPQWMTVDASSYTYSYQLATTLIAPRSCREGYVFMVRDFRGATKLVYISNPGMIRVEAIADGSQTFRTWYVVGFFGEVGRRDPEKPTVPNVTGTPPTYLYAGENWFEDPEARLWYDININTLGKPSYVTAKTVGHTHGPARQYAFQGNQVALSGLKPSTVNWVGHVS